MEKEMCVLVERDYKGIYERFALTPEEFKKDFIAKSPDIPEPTGEAEAYTLKPMVHIWYVLAEVGESLWKTFFSDMTWGLPERDIKNKNYAYIRRDLMNVFQNKVITEFKEYVD